MDFTVEEFDAVASQFQLGGLVTESQHPLTLHLSEQTQHDVRAPMSPSPMESEQVRSIALISTKESGSAGPGDSEQPTSEWHSILLGSGLSELESPSLYLPLRT